MVKNPSASAEDSRDSGSIPGLRRSPGEGHGTTLQYPCLKNPMNKGSWSQELDTTEHVCVRVCAHTHTRTHTPSLQISSTNHYTKDFTNQTFMYYHVPGTVLETKTSVNETGAVLFF